MRNCRNAFIIILAGLCCSSSLYARPISHAEAQKAVRGWLKADAKPLEAVLGTRVGDIDVYADSMQQPVYFIVHLQPAGFVIAAADDEIEPVVGFAAGGTFDPSPDNPLGALVESDLPSRMAAVREQASAAGKLNKAERDKLKEHAEKAKKKWSDLLAFADTPSLAAGTSSISDVRVSPLVQSRWDQDYSCYLPQTNCYNYYTPNNYVCGCVATAMAQLLRFYQFPTGGLTRQPFTIKVDDVNQQALLRGGDGVGGPYNWSLMPLVPDCSTTLAQRQAIGSLCYDTGVSVNMRYAADGSAASVKTAKDSLLGVFGYANGVYGQGSGGTTIGAGLIAMVNPNLDAGLPVMLSISDPTYGHAVLADGYGYNLTTLYHHLNMGWGGSDDAWYNLPTITTTYYAFNSVDGCAYNIYQSGSGEIISGRAVTAYGTPISGVTIIAQANGTPTYTAVTGSNGIYALTKVLKNKTYTVTASKAGMEFLTRTAAVGSSADGSSTCGNVWGIDFVDTLSHPPTALNGTVSVAAGSQITVSLGALDEGLPNPPGKLTYTITALPRHGQLNDPCAGAIMATDLPYTLKNYGSKVGYVSCASYVGSDTFYFRASDGGTAPNGGDSNTALITVTVQLPLPTTIYQTSFTSGLPTGWSIVDGGNDGKTWMNTNPKGRLPIIDLGTFMLVDSDWAGSVNMDEQLISQAIDCSALQQVSLSFNHYFVYFSGETADVDVRVNGGSWQNVARYQSTTSGTVQLNLSALADHQANVQLRWHYHNANYDWYWGISDVKITAITLPAPIAGDFGQNCIVDLEDFATLAQAWLSHSGQNRWNPSCDISTPADNLIDTRDLAVFVESWLRGI